MVDGSSFNKPGYFVSEPANLSPWTLDCTVFPPNRKRSRNEGDAVAYEEHRHDLEVAVESMCDPERSGNT